MNSTTSAGASFLMSIWSMFRKGLKLIRTGRFSDLWNQLSYRLNSTSFSYGLHRELHQPFSPRPAKIDISVRLMKEGDVDTILDHEELKRSFPELVNKRRKLAEANIPDGFVAVTDDDTPCYMQWLMGPDQNERIASFFGKSFPKLKKDEALIEGAFANPTFRGNGVMPEAMSEIAMQANQIKGVRRVITFVGAGNIPSLKGCKRAGFSPYVLKKDRRFLFQHKVSFHPIPDEMLVEYHKATGGKKKKRSVRAKKRKVNSYQN